VTKKNPKNILLVAIDTDELLACRWDDPRCQQPVSQ